MTPTRRLLKDGLLPLGAFATATALHFVWLGLFPDQDPSQSQWALLPDDRTWLGRYLGGQEYWLGYCYGLSVAFASVAFRRYRRNRHCCAGRFAVGGATVTGVLAVAGCTLVGCCGSPLLVVWLGLLGARFLPSAKPFLAALTTASIAGAWWWMARSAANTAPPPLPKA